MSAMFTWAMKEGLALNDPVVNTNKRDEKPRDRVLTDDELGLIWRNLPNGHFGTIVKLSFSPASARTRLPRSAGRKSTLRLMS